MKDLFSSLIRLWNTSGQSLQPFRIAIFISGRGSNMKSIIDFVNTNHQQNRFKNVEIKAVISDQPQADGLKLGNKLGVPSVYLDPGSYKSKFDKAAEERYLNFLNNHNINFICLAGFMRIIKQRMINQFPNRIINVHPSLLPDYPGLNTHERVLGDGRKMTGCTIHLVDEGVDTGRILVQKKVRIARRDDVASLTRKVIRKEHLAYREALEKIFLGRIVLDRSQPKTSNPMDRCRKKKLSKVTTVLSKTQKYSH